MLLMILPAYCSAAPLTVHVSDPAGQPVAGIVVYVEGDFAAAEAARSTLEIQQQDKRFAPYLGVARKDTRVLFRNADDITHHVYSFNGPKRFSFKMRPHRDDTVQRFEQTGVIAMGCNIHDWMNGYLLVVDTPWFTTTDSDGKAVFEDIPPGRHRVVAWHPQLQETEPLSRPVALDGPTQLRLRLTRAMQEIPSQHAVDDFDFLEGY